MHVSVCICSYKRPELLKQALLSLEKQETQGRFAYSIVVADNDPDQSGMAVVSELRKCIGVPIIYYVEPRRNISHARNKSLAHAEGDLIAFIDDDEFVGSDWLFRLVDTMLQNGVDGVLGPVRPVYGVKPPAWVVKAGLYERPEHPTGHNMHWSECRTGNVLFRRQIIEGIDPVFLPEFGTGGGDVNFFFRMMQQGHRFVWCNEAVAMEIVPASRLEPKFMLTRALLRGGNSIRDRSWRWSSVLKSTVAVPGYLFALPFLKLAGHHLFMKYLIKWCDHAGRLLAIFGLQIVKERPM